MGLLLDWLYKLIMDQAWTAGGALNTGQAEELMGAGTTTAGFQ
jgi:hypothetical protein